MVRRDLIVTVGAVALMALFGLLTPSGGVAAVRSGARQLPAPASPPSLSPQSSPTQQAQYLSGVSVTLDDRAGTIHLVESFYDASYWHQQVEGGAASLGFAVVSLDTDCRGYDSSELSIALANPTGMPSATEAVLTGFMGSAPGTLTFDGNSYISDLQHPGFVGLDLRCVMVVPSGTETGTNVQQPFHFYFSGYAPTPLPVLFEGALAHPQARPRTLYLSADGTLDAYGMRWSNWNSQVAVGRGRIDWHGCRPDCASGRRHTARGVIHLSHIHACSGRRYYSHLSVYVPAHGRLRLLPTNHVNWAPC